MNTDDRKAKKELAVIYAVFIMYFIHNGLNSFMPKYFGEIGISDSQIGVINAVAAIVSSLCQPFWGSLTDRVKYKKYIAMTAAFLSGGVYFLTGLTVKFVPVLIGISFISMVNMNFMPCMNAIALEHITKHRTGRLADFGILRMMGTVGYQTGALAIGLVLSGNLRSLLFVMGADLIAVLMLSFFLPNVEGHQNKGEKVSYFSLFRDRRVVMLMGMIFLAEITQQFNQNFLTKLQGDLGMSNASTGIITFLSVGLELPICFFAYKIYKKFSMWTWLLIAFVVNALRWFAYSQATTSVQFILIGLPGVTIMACFELFPAFYLNEIISDKLKASAQGMLSIFTFGLPKVVGCLAGGFIADNIGLQQVYFYCGIYLIILAAVFIVPCRKMTALDRKFGEQ